LEIARLPARQVNLEIVFYMKQWNYRKGQKGEEMAREYLEKKGFGLIMSNYVCKIGQIDLVMEDEGWLVFVEVKFKSDDLFGTPEEMFGKSKLAQVKRVATWFLMEKREVKKRFEKYRIDAVCILGDEIRYYRNVY
jgi:putative endonuclease